MRELNREDVIQALSDAIIALPEGKARNVVKQLRLGVTYGMFGPFNFTPSFSPNHCAEHALPPSWKTTLIPAEEVVEGYVPPQLEEMLLSDKKSVVTYLEHVHGCPKVIE